MTSKIEELKAEQAKELAKLEREEAVASSLPIPAARVYSHGEFVGVTYAKQYPERHSFAEALAILEAYRGAIVISEHWRDGCLSCRPTEINRSAIGGTLDGQHAVELVLSQGRGYSSHKLEFWVRVSGVLIEVSIEISPLWKWLPQTEFRYDTHGNCTKNRVQPHGIGEDQFVKWWSPEGSYRISYYWADMPNFDAWASHEIEQDIKNAQAAHIK